MTQLELDKLVQEFLVNHCIISAIGQASICDALGTPYVSLINGIEYKRGTIVDAWWTRADMPMWRNFSAELILWLNGRNRIFWQSEPMIDYHEVVEIDFSNIANREAVIDGLEKARASEYIVKRCYITCRLSAYRSC